MKNILNTLLIINIFFLSNACTKTAIDPVKETVKEPVDERFIDTTSYSRWLPAFVPIMSPTKIYRVISGTPRTLTADILKNGKVLVFGRKSQLDQPYLLPFKQSYYIQLSHGNSEIITRRTYFIAQVARITVYDSLISKTIIRPPYYPFSIDPSNYNSEFRCIIVPPALKAAAIRARINWKDYNAVTSYFKIAP